ncbi:MAG TPA: sulfatase-like hydrolase/transferase [Anaerolineae bacterium]|jgi:arylsulfatase A-like enzyme
MTKSTDRFNTVFIVADQWRGDCLGLLDGPHPVMTPHVNQLAAEGVRFTQAYADCPLCMPQRATMLTGQYASRFGLPYNFWPDHRTPVAPATGLPGRLTREAGYQTKAIGKMHFYPDRARLGFEHIVLHPNDYVNWLEDQGFGGMYRGHGLGGNEVYPAVSAVPERFSHTHWIVRFPPDFPILQPSLEIDAPVLTADICPTLLSLAQLEPGPDSDGVSLLPAVQSGQVLDGRVIFGESVLSAFATDGRYKYIYYPEGGIEQLFDLAHDAYDLTNLAATDQHQAIRAGLRGKLIDHLSRFNRPMVDNGDLICLEPQLDEAALRAQNPMAWRGPLRYGQGY